MVALADTDAAHEFDPQCPCPACRARALALAHGWTDDAWGRHLEAVERDGRWYNVGRLVGSPDPRTGEPREALLWRWGVAEKLGYWRSRMPRRQDSSEELGVRPLIGKAYGSAPPMDLMLADIARAYRDPRCLTEKQRKVIHAYYVKGLGGRAKDREGGTAEYNRHEAAYYEEHGRLPGDDTRRNDSLIGNQRVAAFLHISPSNATEVRQRAVERISRYLARRWDAEEGREKLISAILEG
jgi:hypothetical protein